MKRRRFLFLIFFPAAVFLFPAPSISGEKDKFSHTRIKKNKGEKIFPEKSLKTEQEKISTEYADFNFIFATGGHSTDSSDSLSYLVPDSRKGNLFSGIEIGMEIKISAVFSNCLD